MLIFNGMDALGEPPIATELSLHVFFVRPFLLSHSYSYFTAGRGIYQLIIINQHMVSGAETPPPHGETSEYRAYISDHMIGG